MESAAIFLDLISSDSDFDDKKPEEYSDITEGEEYLSEEELFLKDDYGKLLNISNKITFDFSKESDKEKEESKKDIKLICIDPAPKNAGFCISNWRTLEVIKVFKQCFIDEKEEDPSDPGNTKLISNIKKFIDSETKKVDGIFNNDLNEIFIFIENQTVGQGNSFDKGEKRRSFTNSKNITVQNVFQTTFGERCIVINPRSIKTHFKERFPTYPDLNRSQQYRLNKKNAIAFGKTLIPQNIRFRLENKYKKIDDVYDAAVMKKYTEDVFEIIYDEENLKYIARKKEKKRKRTTKKIMKNKKLKLK